MSNNFRWALPIGLLALCCCLSCNKISSGQYYYVEVAPAKFVPLRFPRLLPENMVIKYGGRIVTFECLPGLNPPDSLMEFGGKLYVLAFDASGKRAKDWRWRCFEQDGDHFKEIPASSYPRSIAILNLWRPGDPRRYSTGMEGERLDQLVLARECDIESRYFSNTDQARMWFMLEVENSYEAAYGRKYDTEDRSFIRQFKAKYNPVHLTSMEMKPVPKKERDF